jgi:UDPglucose 6-dehydrogenase
MTANRLRAALAHKAGHDTGEENSMKLVVVGTGYVGLVTGACLADIGHDVICVDNNRRKIEALRQGVMPIYEPHLEDIVKVNSTAGRLRFSEDLQDAAQDARAAFIAVGTPSRDYDGHTDRSFVFAAAREMGPALPSDAVVVVKSTVPVGTCDEMELVINGLRQGSKIPVVSNPEFLRAGSAVRDFMEPDRIVVGADDGRARDVMQRIFAPMRPKPLLLFTGRRSSELIKYGSNALLAAKVAFINEMADLCERTGADVQEVAHAVGLDRRIGPRFLQPGPGFGGSCFRKDAMALVKMGEDHDAIMRVTEAVVTSNECRKRLLLRKVATALGGSVRDMTVALWGVTFKPNTDDIRESPAIPLIAALLEGGAKVRLYDPEGLAAARALWRDRVHVAPDACACARGADAVVVMTEWDEFKRVDMARLRRLMASPIIVDMRNIYRSDEMAKLGFAYYSIGRPVRIGNSSALQPIQAHDRQKRFNGKEPLTPVALS